MSHFDHDEPQDSNEDIDAFEQQLRSLRPTPPMESWSSIAESIELSLAQPAAVPTVSPTTSAWRPVVSHSVTAAIGMGLGVAMMFTLQSDQLDSKQTVSPPAEASVPVEVAGHQESADAQQAAAEIQETGSLATASESSRTKTPRSEQAWRSHRFTKTTLRSGPLRAFGSIGDSARLTQTGMEFDSQRRSRQRDDVNSDDASLEPPDDFPVDKPVLSPRSLHIFLDDLTCLPTSDVPFCKAEGSQS